MLRASWGPSLLIGILSVTLVSGTGVARGDAATLRVVSYNMHVSRGTDGKLDLERVAEVIKAAEPDIVALQEVDRGVRRTGRVDQPKRLAQLTSMHVVFAANFAYQGGEYGQAVLSRHPIIKTTTHPLPHAPGTGRHIALEARVDLGDRHGSVAVVATHLDHLADPSDRIAQAKRLNALFAPQSDTARSNLPALLVGDLNATPGSEPIAILERGWQRAAPDNPAPTFPAGEPTRKIDYVLYRPRDRWQVRETRVLEAPVASDHRPFLAVLALAKPSAPADCDQP